MIDITKNFAKVTLSTGYDSSAVSVDLETGDGANLPDTAASGSFNVVWWNATDYGDPSDDPNVEIVRCTNRSTDTLTITRAQEGTSASNHNTANKTYKMILSLTKKTMDEIDSHLSGHSDTVLWSELDLTISDIADIATKSHTSLSDIGTNTHIQVDSHIADGSLHFTEGSIDHGSIGGLGDDDHSQYILADGTRPFTGNQSFGDFNITNVGDIALDSISDDAGVANSLSIANLNTAYDHSQDNTQAHSDYMTNNGDTGTGDYGFDGAVTINEAGADKDFRVEGVGQPNALFVDGATGRIGVGTNAPLSMFHIQSPLDGFMSFEDTGNGVRYDMGSVGGYMRLKDNGLTNTTFIRFAGTTSLDLNADTSIRFNTNKNDRDTIIYGDLAEIARFDAGTESLDFDDNQQVKFGTGGDSEIYYNGTDLQINPKVVGTGRVNIIGSLQATDYYSGDGSQGLSATYTFGGGASGDVAQMTFKDGLLTAVTTVP